MDTKPTRGERNNNPGNIRKTQTAWRGEVPGTDPAFEAFTSAKMGIRALAVLLMNYGDAGFNTIEKIIRRYAPSIENDTNAYINAVAKDTGFDKTRILDLGDSGILQSLAIAIIKHENGRNVYSAETIADGIKLATG